MSYKSCVVIGAGIGGLSAAALMAQKGLKVTVLEANPSLVGGLAAPVPVGETACSFGPRYVWNFREGEFGNRFLKKLGLDKKIKFVRLDKDGFDHVYHPDFKEPFKVPADLELYVKKLGQLFPRDKKNIEGFFKACKRHYDVLAYLQDNNYQFKKTYKLVFPLITGFWSRPMHVLTFVRYYFSTVTQVFNKYDISPEARQIITSNLVIFNEDLDNLSFHPFAYLTLAYLNYSCFPQGGMGTIIDNLVKVLEDNGGELLKGEKVVGITPVKNTKNIESVKTESGKTYKADLFISNIDPTCLNQIYSGENEQKATSYHEFNHGKSVYTVFMEVNERIDLSTAFGTRNIWSWEPLEQAKNGEISNEALTSIYYNSPSESYAEKPDNSRHGSISLSFTYPYEKVEWDEDLLKDYIVKSIQERFLPELQPEDINAWNIYAPKDIENEFNATGGNIYGKALTVKNFNSRIPPQTNYNNLFQVGQYAPVGAVVNVMQSAAYVYSELFDDKV